MNLLFQIDKITKKEAEKTMMEFTQILEDRGFPVKKMEISETIGTEYKLKDDILYEETFFQHKLVKK